jgi:hypothetical protein
VTNPDGRARTKRHGLTHILDKPDIQGTPFAPAPCAVNCLRINEDCHSIDPRHDDLETEPAPRRRLIL